MEQVKKRRDNPHLPLVLCKNCGKRLSNEKIRKHAIFCNRICSSQFKKSKKVVWHNAKDNTCSGALAELFVCYDLLKRGHTAYRSVSNTGQTDIIAIINKKLVMIEVRAAQESSGKRSFAKKESDSYNSDIYGVVFDKEITYLPTKQGEKRKIMLKILELLNKKRGSL